MVKIRLFCALYGVLLWKGGEMGNIKEWEQGERIKGREKEGNNKYICVNGSGVECKCYLLFVLCIMFILYIS